MGEKHGGAWDGIKIVYHAYQASQTFRSLGDGGRRMIHAVNEATLFVIVLSAAIALSWAAASVVSYVVRVAT